MGASASSTGRATILIYRRARSCPCRRRGRRRRRLLLLHLLRSGQERVLAAASFRSRWWRGVVGDGFWVFLMGPFLYRLKLRGPAIHQASRRIVQAAGPCVQGCPRCLCPDGDGLPCGRQHRPGLLHPSAPDRAGLPARQCPCVGALTRSSLDLLAMNNKGYNSIRFRWVAVRRPSTPLSSWR